MSFGPRKPTTGPPRATRPTIVKKSTTTKAPVPRKDPTTAQRTAKPKANLAVAPPAKKSSSVVPKATPPTPEPVYVVPKPKPPTPEPVYDYESDFESDESVPSGNDSSSDAEEPSEDTGTESCTSQGGDDESDDDLVEDEIAKSNEARSESRPAAIVLEPQVAKYQHQQQQVLQKSNPRNARSVDILSKISLNDVTVDLYKFDPEEYAELRTHFGVTLTDAHAKHAQTDSSLRSTAQQTSRILMRDRYTSMHATLHGLQGDGNEEESLTEKENDEDELQNYSSLQNIERMFTSLNGALERRFSKHSPLFPGMSAGGQRRKVNSEQRSVLMLVRRTAPIFEALLETKRTKCRAVQDVLNGGNVESANEKAPDERRVPSTVVRSFDTGKMCPDYEVKLVRPKRRNHEEEKEGQTCNDGLVIEFWARGTYSRPMYRFSSWTMVNCVDYDCRRQMMVFGGTSDGTLQMWLGNAGRCHSEILPPHQIVAPAVGRRHHLACWELVTVKVLPVPVTRDSAVDTANENALYQVFALFSTGIIVVWHVQVDAREVPSTTNALNARLGQPDVSMVQSKVIDLNSRIGSRLPFDALRCFGNLLLHDHHQMVLSSHRTVVRLSHFIESQYDPTLLVQPDPAHSIVNLKRMAQTTDTLFALYSNRTVRVLKLNTAPNGTDGARHHHRKHDNQPSLMLSVCTNKSCTIQSIVHDEAKRYGTTSGSLGGRADGGPPRMIGETQKSDDDTLSRPRFHHGQQILFFGSCHAGSLLGAQTFDEKSMGFQQSS